MDSNNQKAHDVLSAAKAAGQAAGASQGTQTRVLATIFGQQKYVDRNERIEAVFATTNPPQEIAGTFERRFSSAVTAVETYRFIPWFKNVPAYINSNTPSLTEVRLVLSDLKGPDNADLGTNLLINYYNDFTSDLRNYLKIRLERFGAAKFSTRKRFAAVLDILMNLRNSICISPLLGLKISYFASLTRGLRQELDGLAFSTLTSDNPKDVKNLITYLEDFTEAYKAPNGYRYKNHLGSFRVLAALLQENVSLQEKLRQLPSMLWRLIDKTIYVLLTTYIKPDLNERLVDLFSLSDVKSPASCNVSVSRRERFHSIFRLSSLLYQVKGQFAARVIRNEFNSKLLSDSLSRLQLESKHIKENYPSVTNFVNILSSWMKLSARLLDNCNVLIRKGEDHYRNSAEHLNALIVTLLRWSYDSERLGLAHECLYRDLSQHRSLAPYSKKNKHAVLGRINEFSRAFSELTAKSGLDNAWLEGVVRHLKSIYSPDSKPKAQEKMPVYIKAWLSDVSEWLTDPQFKKFCEDKGGLIKLADEEGDDQDDDGLNTASFFHSSRLLDSLSVDDSADSVMDLWGNVAGVGSYIPGRCATWGGISTKAFVR